ncbi:MAG TPA: mechanosensitive ion channel domain-containing protein, partial [Anaeromyxobacteraceae bacterium]|nr:mechanosensitive ion channel domain-containing protein [Anaeromyxobacteraceae bacterium]
FVQQLGRVFDHNVSSVVAFAEEEGASFLWMVAIFVAVVATVAWAGKRFARRAADDPELATPAEVLSHPVAAGVLIALSLTNSLLPRAPSVFNELAVLLMLPPFLVLVRNLLAVELRTPLYRLTALFAVVRLAALLPDASLPGRLLLLLVAALGLLGALSFLRRRAPWTGAIRHAGKLGLARLAIGVVAALLAVSVAANVVGNVSLARRLADGSLSTAMIALLLAAVARLLVALLAGSLRMPELRRLPTVAEAHDTILERGTRIVGWGVFLLWVGGTFRVFRVDAVVREALVATFSYRFRFGGIDVSLGDLAAFAVALWLSILLARLLRVVLEARLDRDVKLPPGVAVAIAKTVGYAVVAFGFLVAVLASGMDVTRFTVILGTLSVGIGFGLQNVVNNFVSGLILLYERPIRVGDVIDVGTAMGTVSHIGIRSSTVKTFQGAEVVLPNSQLVSNQLTNWTLSDSMRRVEIDVGVAYGSDVVRVQELLLKSVDGIADVSTEPPPQVLFTGMGDSALNFQLRFWTARFDRYLAIASEVRGAIVRRLGEAGIEIPFPQRDLHVVSVGDDAARALRGAPPAGK